MPNSRRSFCTGNKKPIVTPLTGRECCCNTCTKSHILQWQMVASNAAHWPSSKDAQLTHSCHRHQPCSSWTSRHDWANCQLNADRLPPSVPTQPWPQDLLLLVSTSVLMSASVTDGYDSCWPAPSEGGVKIPLPQFSLTIFGRHLDDPRLVNDACWAIAPLHDANDPWLVALLLLYVLAECRSLFTRQSNQQPPCNVKHRVSVTPAECNTD